MVDITVGKVGTGKSLGQSNMVDITEGIVGTGQLGRCCYRSLRSSSRGLQTLLVDLVIGGQQSVVTVRVGGAEGLQVVGQLACSHTGQDQQYCSRYLGISWSDSQYKLVDIISL